MTREEAKYNILQNYSIFDNLDSQSKDLFLEAVESRIDEIYDDSENRLCENCKFLIGKDKLSECTFRYKPENLYEFEFGCIKFKRKEK